MQPAPQSRLPAGQAHVPALQVLPLGHETPQPPQFAGSAPVFTQTPLHLLKPGAQAQAPLEQLSPAPQAMPQPPQFFGSLRTSVQVPSAHWTEPAAQPQTPF